MVSYIFWYYLIQCNIYYHISKDDGLIVKLEHIVDVPSDEDDDTLKGILKNRLINFSIYSQGFHAPSFDPDEKSIIRVNIQDEVVDEDDESFPLLKETNLCVKSGSKSLTRQNRYIHLE